MERDHRSAQWRYCGLAVDFLGPFVRLGVGLAEERLDHELQDARAVEHRMVLRTARCRRRRALRVVRLIPQHLLRQVVRAVEEDQLLLREEMLQVVLRALEGEDAVAHQVRDAVGGIPQVALAAVEVEAHLRGGQHLLVGRAPDGGLAVEAEPVDVHLRVELLPHLGDERHARVGGIRVAGVEGVAREGGLRAVVLVLHRGVRRVGHVDDEVLPRPPLLQRLACRRHEDAVARVHPRLALVLHVRPVDGIHVEVRHAYVRQDLADPLERPVLDVVAVSDQDHVRTEVPRREHELPVRDAPAPRTYPQRREQARHVAVGELAQAPVVADRAAHELAPRSHPQVAVPADHQVVDEKDAERSEHGGAISPCC